ncbi:winged helix-turn-helix domain-containing protein [Lachnotalea glycerini]|uniref:OmpR/PhoB-type domain-containing protein n=1 Tax=Lachnotalea glycerini TaxID=1763509 RepID=A0A371J5A4_9FIRM|nr:winged helix-turn-helix domain-containing protein [Lachnotalea glycerini]RDY27970.1 hypothetical protein CG710_020000 [Lachnotalea glycerini]
MSRKKYDDKFKMRVVKEYETGGISCYKLGIKYNVDAKCVRSWCRLYKEFGIVAFTDNHANINYSAEFKTQVVNSYLEGGKTYQAVALAYGIFAPTTVRQWVMQYNMQVQKSNECYDDGNLWIDFSTFSAKVDEKEIMFTPMEFKTLKLLVNNADKVLTRQVLLEKLWDMDENYVDEHTLTTLISRIRNKIENGDFTYIKTIYGMGYMWLDGDKT